MLKLSVVATVDLQNLPLVIIIDLEQGKGLAPLVNHGQNPLVVSLFLQLYFLIQSLLQILYFRAEP